MTTTEALATRTGSTVQAAGEPGDAHAPLPEQAARDRRPFDPDGSGTDPGSLEYDSWLSLMAALAR